MRILIVEDEPAHAEAIRRAFKAAEAETEIVVAASLREFRSCVAERLPDIAVMDMNLPDGRATEVLIHPPEAGDFPALVMTSYGNEQIAVEAMKAGALDYLVKSPEAFVNMPRIVARAMREWSLLQERKQTEDALRKSEAQYRQLSGLFNALLDAIPDSIILQTPDLKVLWANNSAAACVQMKPEQLVGMHCYEFWHKQTEPCNPCPAVKSFRSGEAALEIINLPGGRTWEIRTIPVKEEGSIVNVIEVGRDITEHRKLEAKYLHAQKMESIGTLAGGIAHDFNNILTAIIGYGEMALMRMADDNPQRPNIESMLEGADRAAHLTKELLLFSRKQSSEQKPVNLNEVIKKVEKFLKRVIGEDIEYKTVLFERTITVLADRNQLEQVLVNLATNARDSMPDGGIITVSTEEFIMNEEFVMAHGYGNPGPYAVISVADTGSGIDEETRKRIFEPFFTTKEIGKGTGLGLAVAYGIIKQHEGYIEVCSEPGHGSIFRTYLPLIAMEAKEESKLSREEAPPSGTETVLLAEDDQAIRFMTNSVLTNFGYTVIEAVDGEDAVNKFMVNRGRIQLLLFDMIMPKMNGNEAYDKIQQIEPDIKVIFVSGYAPEFVRQKASLAINAHFFSKPSSPLELLWKVRNVLDGAV